jgi:hypothetical protein
MLKHRGCERRYHNAAVKWVYLANGSTFVAIGLALTAGASIGDAGTRALGGALAVVFLTAMARAVRNGLFLCPESVVIRSLGRTYQYRYKDIHSVGTSVMPVGLWRRRVLTLELADGRVRHLQHVNGPTEGHRGRTFEDSIRALDEAVKGGSHGSAGAPSAHR